MPTPVYISDEELIILLCSSENAPIECKSITTNSSFNNTAVTLSSCAALSTSSTLIEPNRSSTPNAFLHEILPYITGALVILMIYIISVCFLRFAAKLSWVHAVSLALGLIFKGQDGNPCCICHQTMYAPSVGTAIPAVSPGIPDILRRGVVQPADLNVQETPV
jgi:type IV secretory pathway VirB2 component (pilin)